MNLINKLGGYERAKEILEDAPASCCFLDIYDNSYLSKDHDHYWESWDSDKKEWSECEFDVDQDGLVHLSILNKSLLEYRREHGIYEVGDKIVFIESKSCDAKIFKIKDILDGMFFLIESRQSFKKNFRHATDLEIKAGHRLP